jgi:hypothetical protein
MAALLFSLSTTGGAAACLLGIPFDIVVVQINHATLTCEQLTSLLVRTHERATGELVELRCEARSPNPPRRKWVLLLLHRSLQVLRVLAKLLVIRRGHLVTTWHWLLGLLLVEAALLLASAIRADCLESLLLVVVTVVVAAIVPTPAAT